MIRKRDLETLLQRESNPANPVLSVYLDTDQSKATNVNRAFEVVLKNMLRDIGERLDKFARKEFETDAEQVLHVVAGLRLRVARSHPVRELRSARAAAAGCEQLAGDRVAEFSKPDSPVLGETPVPVTFSGPVRVCVYRVFTEGFADFVRGGVLPAVPIGEPRAGAPCAEPSTLFAWLRNAEDPYRDGDVRVQLTGCRQMLIEPAAGQIGLARADPALIALLSGPA